MKNWFKKLSALAFTLALTLGLSLPAFADSDITFKSAQEGFAITSDSTYTDTDLFDGLKGAMPGDLLTDTVEITNDATDSDLIRVYLRAEPHDATVNPPVYQGGETVASMQDFLSQLTMRVYNGTELIYESSPDQPDALTENVYLGDIANGETLTLNLELEVPIELGNEYANRAGEVDWVFLAEGITYETLTVNKVWEDNGYPNRPDNVKVNLLRDGEVYATADLNASDRWTYTWQQLDDRYEWTVEEQVPNGYDARYAADGDTVTITNHMDYVPPAGSDDHPEIEQAIKDGTWGSTPTPAPAANGLIPQTSDTLPLTALVVVLIVAAVAIVALVVLRKRNAKQDEQK